MAEKMLTGKGRHFKEIPRKSWEEEVAIRSQHIPAVLDFMTRDHHRIRNLVVEEISRRERPISARGISEKLDMPHSKVSAILDDLENNLFFLVRGRSGDVTWAFPVTAETTRHKLTFNTGEKPHAA